MADSDNYGGGFLVGVLITLAFMHGCKPELTEREDYQSGYDVGHADGYEEGSEEGKTTGRKEICDEVEYRLNYGAANAVGC